jgi:4-amino-4-deoxy-L-arabinose transferase-like glycosyltransferase
MKLQNKYRNIAVIIEKPDWRRIAFWAILILGAVLRFAALGKVPAGLNSDEASTGVEALSILQTGMDRWGNPLPVWFPAWGSGMNALYSYITVPVVALFGLNVVTLRAVGALFGFLTLPVAYRTARLYFGRGTALLTMTLLAVLPWHVMSSRWALDSNLLPFFFTLGLFTLGNALENSGKWPLMAFIPWAVAIYAYPVGIVPIVLSSLGTTFFFRRRILGNPWPWVGGVVAATIIALPFLLFLIKNQLGVAHLPFEGSLPFSIPVLPATRLSQIGGSFLATVFANLTFLIGGYRDGAGWHQSIYFPPLTGVAPYLTLLGLVTLGWASIKNKQPNVVLIVAATAVIPMLFLPLNLTRFNWFYIPSMMIAAHFLTQCRRIVQAASAAYLAVFVLLFVPYYFIRYNDEITVEDVNLGNGFRVGLEDALRHEMALAQPGEPVYVAVGTVHPYLYVLFYGLGDIRAFQATRQVKVVDGVYRVSQFGRFYFDPDALPAGKSFVFVSRSDRLPCAAPVNMTAGPLWSVGRCP